MEYLLRAVKNCDITNEVIPLSKLSKEFRDKLNNDEDFVSYPINGMKLSSKGDYLMYEPIVYFKKVGVDDYDEDYDELFESGVDSFKFVIKKDIGDNFSCLGF